MSVNCEELLKLDILQDCDANPIAGLESSIVLINRADIDYSAITYSPTNDLLVTNFQLLSGKVGYKLEGINQSNYVGDELVIKDYANSYMHTVGGVILNPTVENRKSLEILMSGSEFVVVVNKKWKGSTTNDAFAIFGLESGLVGATSTYKSNESDGVEIFELKSKEGYEEPKKYRTLLDTNYATTLAQFDANFSEA